MQQGLWKKAVPHLIAFGVFTLVALFFFKPSLEGKVLNQSDIVHYTGMARQSELYKQKYGHYPLWTESAFSGMPAYTIANPSSATLLNKLVPFLYSYNPVVLFVFSCLTFYLLCMVVGVSPWIGILSSIAYTYSTFMPIILAVGHTTQMLALAFMPGVIAGFLLILGGRRLWGAALFTIMLGLQATVTQHIQVIYYTAMVMGFIAIARLVRAWREKTMPATLKGLGIAAVCAAVAFCTNAVAYLPLQEYAKETMRGGKSELTQADSKNKTKGGLDKDYAFMWSYGIGETATLFVPDAYGGGYLSHPFSEESKFADKLTEVGMPADNAYQYANNMAYWGNQPSTAGPVYVGAVICFLAILGAVFVKSWNRWWLIAVSLFGIVLAWGANFSGFNYFLFDHLPFYNKFRAPTMSLVIPQLCLPLLAALGMQTVLARTGTDADNWKRFKFVLYGSVALIVVCSLIYFTSDFHAAGDQQFKQRFSSAMLQQMARGKQPTPEMSQRVDESLNGLLQGIRVDRQGLFQASLIRSVLFLIAAGLLTAVFLKRKIGASVWLAAVVVIGSIDLIAEDRKYLNDENFVEAVDLENEFKPSSADEEIAKDPDQNFRVFDESSGAYHMDSHASYFHNSIGGYSPAKLALYQDLIENQLNKGNPGVLNMLNTRYVIRPNVQGSDNEAIRNPDAFGPCWLVKGLKFVPNADAEMKALDSTDLRDTAVLRDAYRASIATPPVFDSTASVKLLENLNDKIRYSFQAKSEQFAVFSEIYYDKGWNAYLDGSKVPYYKVNYVLRGMPVPAGSHTIEFRFEPTSIVTGARISLIASVIGYLLLLAALYATWKSRNRTA